MEKVDGLRQFTEKIDELKAEQKKLNETITFLEAIAKEWEVTHRHNLVKVLNDMAGFLTRMAEKGKGDDIRQIVNQYISACGYQRDKGVDNFEPFIENGKVYIYLPHFQEYIKKEIPFDSPTGYSSKEISQKISDAGGYRKTLNLQDDEVKTTRSFYNISNLVNFEDPADLNF